VILSPHLESGQEGDVFEKRIPRTSGSAISLILRVIPLLLAAQTAEASCGAGCVLVNVAGDAIHASCGPAGIGTCSLRDAFLQPVQVVHFAIGSGSASIALTSDLPDVAGLTIDGTTQPGYAGSPLIEITRDPAGTATHGLRKRYFPATGASGFFVLKGLVINGFNGQCPGCGAVILNDPSDTVREGGNVITNCWIGTDATGSTPAAVPNTYGIQDNTQGGNTFGGTTAADRNVISGNAEGITIGTNLTGYSVQTVIQGNYFGTDATGTVLVGNTYDIITDAPFPGFSPGIVIGGPAPGAGNVLASSGNCIQMSNGINNVIQNNRIGVDVTGTKILGTEVGIILYGETNDTILGNQIAGMSGTGIYLNETAGSSVPTKGTVIQGNLIGTDVTGNAALRTTAIGIQVGGNAPNNTIGGAGAGQGNVIGGLSQAIYVTGDGFGGSSTGNVIQGNLVGIGSGGAAIPNSSQAIVLTAVEGGTTIGGIDPGEGNVIALNSSIAGFLSPGIDIVDGPGNVIRGNSIYGNSGLGIDFVFPYSTTPYPNDPGDGDLRPNGLQNFPILTSVTFPDPAHVRIQGNLNSLPITHYTIDFYANPPPLHPGDFLQGKTWIGLYDNPAISDGAGNLPFDITLPVTGYPNVWISATATDDAGNTSEFSQRSLFAIRPTHGPATGGTPFTLSGQLFQSNATVNVGSPPGGFATGVDVVSATEITGLTPGFPPGLYAVTVTNPDTSTAVMSNAYLMEFFDVAPGSLFYDSVVSLALDGVTAGCGGGDYCPGNSIKRSEMAAFLIRAEHGPYWLPPPATGTVFVDVPAGSFAADYIEELKAEGITSGCLDGLHYCPNDPVLRQEMAVFLLRTEHGGAYVPPGCSGVFSDVTCPSLYADWIERLYAEGITGGCILSPLSYCPTNPVTREQMAAFIVRTFKLP
jgi:hypothetical protein